MGTDDDPPALDEFDTFDAEDNYWLEDTTITVPRIVKASLDEHRDGQNWANYLESLRREHADPLTLNDAEAIAEHLEDALDTASMAADPGATEDAIDDLTREVRKAQELAEQARDAAQRVEEGMH